jgi:hypothetical protein
MRKVMKMADEKKRFGSRMVQVEIIGAIFLMLMLSLFLFKDKGITGFVPVEFTTQDMNITLDQSQSYILTSGSDAPFPLTSLKIGGEVVGDGVVEIYLDNGQGQQLLVYRNTRSKSGGMGSITGLVTQSENGTKTDVREGKWLLLSPLKDSAKGDLPVKLGRDEEASSGAFSKECRDTCFMRMEISNQLSYELIFKIDQGTQLKLNDLTYTIDVT